MHKTRDRQYRKNIFYIVIFQGGAHLVRLVIIPLSLGYLDATRYGLWLVISSVFSWLSFFDLGLGNGLRNKLSESLVLEDFEIARKYVSTTYFLITVISLGLLILFFIAHQFVNWASLLNAPKSLFTEFNQTIILCITFFSVKFILDIIINILTADQHIGLSRVFDFFSNILVLISIFLLKLFTHSSFFYLCMAMVIPQVIVLFGMSAYLFNTRYRKIRPSFSWIHLNLGKGLIGLGIKFFIIQVAVMIILSTDNVIITELFGPQAVTPYNIAFQYMAISIFLFSIILAPSWSAYTEANALNDKAWILKTIFRLIKIWCAVAVGLVFLVLVSQPIYTFWIGSNVIIPKTLTILMAVFAAQYSFNSIFTNYINGVGKLNLLLVICILAGILNIPLSVFLAKGCSMGVEGVILASIICNSFGSIATPIQSYLLITEKAKGIWNK